MRFDVNPLQLNREIARELKERKLVTPPDWVPFAKTGSHRERPPASEDWWYHRAAAVLRVVAIKEPVGTSKLSIRFGGRMNRGMKPDKFRKASTNVLRKCLQQLENSGLLKQEDRAGHKGRVLSPNGKKFLKGALDRCRKAKGEKA